MTHSISEKKYYLDKSRWSLFLEDLAAKLDLARKKWYPDLLNKIQLRAGEQTKIFCDKRVLCDETLFPPSTEMATKAFQSLCSLGAITSLILFETEAWESFEKTILKTVAPDQTSRCRGYYSRYFKMGEWEATRAAFLHDVTKGVVAKPFQGFVIKDKEVLQKVDVLQGFCQWCVFVVVAKYCDGAEGLLGQVLDEVLPDQL